MIDPVTITTTATAIAAIIFNKAIEKGGENLGEAISNKIGQIVSVVRNKFKSIGMEGVLTQAQDNPTEPNQKFFQQALEMQMTSDSDFVKKLVELKEQLEKMEGGRQIMASGLELEGDLKAQDMKQKGGQHQEMLTDVKAKNIDLGNLTQVNSSLFSNAHKFRIGLNQSENNIDEIMQFAGSWSDMPEEDFSDFCEEIKQRRQATSSRRFDDETLFT